MMKRIRRRSTPDGFVTFTYRLRSDLVARVDDARWRLRLPSRSALITKAIEDFVALTAGDPPTPDELKADLTTVAPA